MSKYKQGDIVTGYVTGIEKYGIFINIDDKYDGLIHISEITSSYVRNINDYAKIGEIIRAKVIAEAKNNQIRLSIKDFDYRITNRKSAKIEKTKKGFSTLIVMLNKWIEAKTPEIFQKNKKK